MIWFTADMHFDHEKVITLCKRPFVTVDEMNHVITDNILEFTDAGDTLYINGDCGYSSGKIETLLKFLKIQGVQVHYIWGNHDKGSKMRRAIKDNVVWYGDMKHIKIEGQGLTICHYALRTWKGSHRGSWNLYAHSHDDLDDIGLQWDVGVDRNDFIPLSWDELKIRMAAKEQMFINHHGDN